MNIELPVLKDHPDTSLKTLCRLNLPHYFFQDTVYTHLSRIMILFQWNPVLMINYQTEHMHHHIYFVESMSMPIQTLHHGRILLQEILKESPDNFFLHQHIHQPGSKTLQANKYFR